jgi:hypothetical protein
MAQPILFRPDPVQASRQFDVSQPLNAYYKARQNQRAEEQHLAQQNMQRLQIQEIRDARQRNERQNNITDRLQKLSMDKQFRALGTEMLMLVDPDSEDFDQQIAKTGAMLEKSLVEHYGFQPDEAQTIMSGMFQTGGMSRDMIRSRQIQAGLRPKESKKKYQVIDGQVVSYDESGGVAHDIEGLRKKPSSPSSTIGKINKDYELGLITEQQRDSAISKAISTKPNTNISIDTGAKSMTELGKEQAKELIDERKHAEDAVEGIKIIEQGEKIIKDGMITGAGANYIINFGKALNQAGFNYGKDPISNSEAYVALMGRQVGSIIKMFGTGTGLSDADREYAEKIVAGKISLNKESITKILSIGKKAYSRVIENYNKKADQVMRKEGAGSLLYDLRVDPGAPENAAFGGVNPDTGQIAPENAAFGGVNPDTGQMEYFDSQGNRL